LAPVADHHLGIWGLTGRVSVIHAWPVWGLAGKEWDHVSGKRCSGLGLPGCDPLPGYAARDLNTRDSELAYGSLQLRDGVRAAPSSSRLMPRMLGGPPFCAPTRVIPGRTLLEGGVRAGSQASPQLQITPSGSPWRLGGVPVSAWIQTVSGTIQDAGVVLPSRARRSNGEALFMKPRCRR
jgi:hypothetical protein